MTSADRIVNVNDTLDNLNRWIHAGADAQRNDNARNQVTGQPNMTTGSSYPYDASGNMVYDGANFHAYDGDGRVCAMQTVAGSTAFGYLYDADGNRVAKGSITRSPNPLTTPLSCDPARNGFQIVEATCSDPSEKS